LVTVSDSVTSPKRVKFASGLEKINSVGYAPPSFRCCEYKLHLGAISAVMISSYLLLSISFTEEDHEMGSCENKKNEKRDSKKDNLIFIIGNF
jgi:hypothetical protein